MAADERNRSNSYERNLKGNEKGRQGRARSSLEEESNVVKVKKSEGQE